MTPERFREVLADLAPLGLSLRGLAAMWGRPSHTTAFQWRDGRTAVPSEVAGWLEELHRWWRENQPRPIQKPASPARKVQAEGSSDTRTGGTGATTAGAGRQGGRGA